MWRRLVLTTVERLYGRTPRTPCHPKRQPCHPEHPGHSKRQPAVIPSANHVIPSASEGSTPHHLHRHISRYPGARRPPLGVPPPPGVPSPHAPRDRHLTPTPPAATHPAFDCPGPGPIKSNQTQSDNSASRTPPQIQSTPEPCPQTLATRRRKTRANAIKARTPADVTFPCPLPSNSVKGERGVDDRQPRHPHSRSSSAQKPATRTPSASLAEEHRAALLRLCYKMTGSHEEAEDLVQETLLKAYTHIAEFELRSSLSTWLFRIATNACLDHQRGRKPWDLDKRWQWFRENGELVKQIEQTLYLSPERSAEVQGGRRDLRQLHRHVAAREAARRDRPLRPDRPLARGSGEVDRRLGRLPEDGAAPRPQDDDRRLRDALRARRRQERVRRLHRRRPHQAAPRAAARSESPRRRSRSPH